MFKYCNIFIFAAILAAMIGISGCAEIKEALEDSGALESDNPNSESFEPHFVVGIFSIVEYPRGNSALEREIESLDGRKIWINTNQSFSSKNIKDVRVVARPGDPDRCDLQFKLDRMGKVQWEMLAGRYRDTPVILVVDGRYVSKFIPDMPDDENAGNRWVTLRVGIDDYTAKGIAKYANKNYYHYNPDAKSWWIF